MRFAASPPHRGYRYKLSIQYLGTKYSGWQKQPSGPQKKSIQKAVELSTFHGNVCTASRTDAGVHAIENISHVDIYHYDKNKNLKDPYPAETVYRALNHYMRKNHEDIVIGNHDFSSFATKNSDNSGNYTMRRTLDFFGVEVDNCGELDFWNAHQHELSQAMKITLKAKSFLTHQIRKMVGSAVCVALKKIKLEQLCEILENKNPSLCPLVAPAHGLYLNKIFY